MMISKSFELMYVIYATISKFNAINRFHDNLLLICHLRNTIFVFIFIIFTCSISLVYFHC